MRRSPRRARALRGLARGALPLALALSGALGEAPADAASAQGLVVVPVPASGPTLSYFKLTAARGRGQLAGRIGLRNQSGKAIRVRLTPVAGTTIDTLGSTYASPGTPTRGSAAWVRLGARNVLLRAGAGVLVPVWVTAPPTARPGDYLAGVSVEALGQTSESGKRSVSIASVVRYAIGVETSLPGPRHPSIRFTGARLERQPAALTFLLDATNPGNVILQNVQGGALITRGGRVLANVPLGPGTFVTSSSIAYPIQTPHERPRQGTVYRVRAYLRYAGGIANLDTLVSFGHAAALRQQLYGGRSARPARSSSPLTWLAALLAGGLLAAGFVVALRRRTRSPLRVLEAGIQHARASGEPLSVMLVTPAGGAATPSLTRLLRSRIRQTDVLCRLDRRTLLLLAPDTDRGTAEVLAADLRRYSSRSGGGGRAVTIEVHPNGSDTNAAELLGRLRRGR